jgi:hypothetical protein
MKVSYIIATYAGQNHYSNGELRNIVLCKVFEQLVQLFHIKREQCLPNLIHEVIVMVPPVKSDDTPLPYYYMPRTWSRQLDEYSVTLKFIDYSGQNIHHSYDQWIQGWLSSSPDSQYFIFSEDDYALDVDNPLADIMLVDHYNKSFPNGIGYLCSYASDLYNYGHHAAISNGMISRTTLEQFDDPLNSYYTATLGVMSQLGFTNLFKQNSIPFCDYNNQYGVLYWSALRHQLEVWGEVHPIHIFMPIHVLYYDRERAIKADG